MAAQSLLSSATVPTQDFLDFFDFREVFFRPFFLLGTFFPFLRASESPMAIACLRLFTFPPLPPLPRFRVPFFLRFIARSTSLPALFEYFLAISGTLLVRPYQRVVMGSVPVPGNRLHKSRGAP